MAGPVAVGRGVKRRCKSCGAMVYGICLACRVLGKLVDADADRAELAELRARATALTFRGGGDAREELRWVRDQIRRLERELQRSGGK